MDNSTTPAGDAGISNGLPGHAVNGEVLPTLADSGALGARHDGQVVVSLLEEYNHGVFPSGPSVVEQGNLFSYLGAGYLALLPVDESTNILSVFWDWYSSYTLSLFLMFTTALPDVVSWGGFVLLIVRLIADGPRAYRVLKDKFGGK